jgi:transcriptional regulator with XRE-family HTH domain
VLAVDFDLAKWVRDARQAAGYTQEKLGELVGVSKANVSGWENGRHLPSVSQTLAISRLTGAKMPFLVGETGRVRPGRPDPLPGRQVPVIGSLRLDPQGFGALRLDEVPKFGVGYLADHDRVYALRVLGDDQDPALKADWLLLIDPQSAVSQGEFALVRQEAESALVGEVLFQRSESLTILSPNGRGRTTLQLADLPADGAQPIIAMLPPSRAEPYRGEYRKTAP